MSDAILCIGSSSIPYIIVMKVIVGFGIIKSVVGVVNDNILKISLTIIYILFQINETSSLIDAQVSFYIAFVMTELRSVISCYGVTIGQ